MKPHYTKPDANQKSIEQYLHQLGFWTYRTANDSPQTNSISQNEFHPLDLLVVGINRATDRVEMTLWEIKVNEKSSFTQQEEQFIHSIDKFFNRITPIGVAYSVDDILTHYNWIKT